MNLRDAIIQGVKIPCECEFNAFFVHKKEFDVPKIPSDARKCIGVFLAGQIKSKKYHRWVASCPECNKTWLADDRKKVVQGIVNKFYKEKNLKCE